MNVPAEQEGTSRQVNIPVDAVVMPKTARSAVCPSRRFGPSSRVRATCPRTKSSPTRRAILSWNVSYISSTVSCRRTKSRNGTLRSELTLMKEEYREGIQDRYLCRSRSPWYAPGAPSACPVPMHLPWTQRQEERPAVSLHPEPLSCDRCQCTDAVSEGTARRRDCQIPGPEAACLGLPQWHRLK